jgi:hypothetical protein
MDGPAAPVRTHSLLGAAAELAEVGAGHSRCLSCRCFRQPTQQALAMLDQDDPGAPIAAYLRKLLASPVQEHG